MDMTVVSNDNNPTDHRVADATIINVSTILKTCHQCRQKRPDLVGSCVTRKKNKTCPIKLCTKCLVNRYGEIAEEVALKDDWTCPKCRGICNCSICMKSRGQNPTGILVHKARNKGFSSVSELLKTDGSEKYMYKKRVKPEGEVLSSALIIYPVNSAEELKDINKGCSDHDNAAVEESSHKKNKISDSVHEPDDTERVLVDGEQTAAEDIKGKNIVGQIKRTKPGLKKKEEDQVEVEVKPPQGNSSITISGMDLASEDAGHVFQFMEFCSAFAKPLELREGQAESVILEMLSGQSNIGQQYSTLTEMIIQILTLISKDRGEPWACLNETDSTSWFNAVGECIYNSEFQLDEFPLDMFEKGISQYEQLDSSKKLKLLNFLCDETLGTSVMRQFIDSQNLESNERKKEAKQKFNAAKDKEKQLKQKLQDELAQAVKERNGTPLSIEERDGIVSRINAEKKEVHSEMQEFKMQKKSQGTADALRTKAVEVDDNGLVFWRLKWDNGEENIFLQDTGSRCEVCPYEKWFSFSSDQKPEVENYITYIRKKRLQAKRNAKTIITSLAASTSEHDSDE